MTALAVATMVVVCGVVWGGFLVLLARAVRSEAAKRRQAASSPPTPGPAPSP